MQVSPFSTGCGPCPSVWREEHWGYHGGPHPDTLPLHPPGPPRQPGQERGDRAQHVNHHGGWGSNPSCTSLHCMGMLRWFLKLLICLWAVFLFLVESVDPEDKFRFVPCIMRFVSDICSEFVSHHYEEAFSQRLGVPGSCLQGPQSARHPRWCGRVSGPSYGPSSWRVGPEDPYWTASKCSLTGVKAGHDGHYRVVTSVDFQMPEKLSYSIRLRHLKNLFQ